MQHTLLPETKGAATAANGEDMGVFRGCLALNAIPSTATLSLLFSLSTLFIWRCLSEPLVDVKSMLVWESLSEGMRSWSGSALLRFCLTMKKAITAMRMIAAAPPAAPPVMIHSAILLDQLRDLS